MATSLALGRKGGGQSCGINLSLLGLSWEKDLVTFVHEATPKDEAGAQGYSVLSRSAPHRLHRPWRWVTALNETTILGSASQNRNRPWLVGGKGQSGALIDVSWLWRNTRSNQPRESVFCLGRHVQATRASGLVRLSSPLNM